MKDLQSKIRLLGVLTVALLAVLGLYIFSTFSVNSGRWANSANNTRLRTAKKTVIPGNITDRNGEILAYTDSDGDRRYSDSESMRRAVSQVVGDPMGMSGTGIETFCATTLYGVTGSLLDRLSQTLSGSQQTGSSISLTLDAELCKYMYKKFPDGYDGAAVIFNYRTGQIIGEVSLPTYDPKKVQRRSDENANAPYLNRVTQGLYPPGSTFKIVTLTSALENISGVQEMRFNCTGNVAVGNGSVTDNGGKGHGEVTLNTAFTRSCNLAFAALSLELGSDTLRGTAETLGFNENFLFRDAVVYESSFPQPESEYELAWAGVGQGRVLVTPLHMVLIAGAVANGGVMMTPKLIWSVTGDSGVEHEHVQASVFKRVMSENTANIIRQYMLDTVDSGTASEAAVSGHRIAGKTGTAEVSSSKSVSPHAWFVGFCADEEHPLAMAVVVENGGHGSDKACVFARRIFTKAFELGY